MITKAASLENEVEHAPETVLQLSFTFDVSEYDLTDKWFKFEARVNESSPVIFRASSSGAYLSISSQTATVAIEPDATNEIVGGDDWETVIATPPRARTKTMEFAVNFGDDSDTDVVEYRIQGDLKILPSHGRF